MIKQSLLASHRISPDEMTEMTEKTRSITKRIRDLELRLVNKGFLSWHDALQEWNPLIELSAQMNIRRDGGPFGTQYVTLPTKECVDILNKLASVSSQAETRMLLNMLYGLR